MKQSHKLIPNHIEDVLSLTPTQEGMFAQFLSDPGGRGYYLQLNLQLTGAIDRDVFAKAWSLVAASHGTLRTVLRWRNLERPLQLVLKESAPRLAYVDLPGRDIEQRRAALEKFLAEDFDRPFDLETVPFGVTLAKVDSNSHHMIIRSHNILLDGWSTAIVVRDFFRAYAGLCSDLAFHLPAATGFGHYIRWLKTRDFQRMNPFWRDYLRGVDHGSHMPVKQPVAPDAAGRQNKHSFQPSESFNRDLDRFCAGQKINMAAVVYCAWAVLLRKYLNTPDVMFGAALAGRPREIAGVLDIAGLFVHSVPLRVNRLSGETCRQIMTRLTADMNTMAGERRSLADIFACGEGLGRQLPFDSMLAVENYPADISALRGTSGLEVVLYDMNEGVQFDLTITVRAFDSLVFDFLYKTPVFDHECILRLSSLFINVLRQVVADPDTPAARVELLAEERRRELTVRFNRTTEERILSPIVPELLRAGARRSPWRIALAGEDTQLSYREVASLVERWSGHLRDGGTRAGDIVALSAERTVDTILAIFGILAAGCAYLPVDERTPARRVREIVADSGARVIVPNRQALPGVEPETTDRRISDPSPADVAYILYTSGSTGIPKGVVVEHGSLANLLGTMQREFPLVAEDVVLFKTSLMFDVSVFELFSWLPGGARLTLLARGLEGDAFMMWREIDRLLASRLHCVPSFFRLLVQALETGTRPWLCSLRSIFLGGEPVDGASVSTFRSSYPWVELENLYGPTETTIYTTTFSLCRCDGNKPVPIGSPLPGTGVVVVNGDGQWQAEGVPGELVIYGPNVGRGYLNRPEATGRSFSPGIDGLEVLRGARCYRTGDLVSVSPDGVLNFWGRLDRQVKVRGFRVECGEIEARLARADGVKEAVVTVVGVPGDESLCAYVVASSSVDERNLRDCLSVELPHYMIPDYFVFLEKIPRLLSNKVDVNSLPQPLDKPNSIMETAGGEDLESQIVDLCAAVLGCPRRQLLENPNLIAAGGHSLRLVRVLLRLQKMFQVQIQLVDILEEPTVGRLCRLVDQRLGTGAEMLPAVEDMDYYPLSPHQRLVWLAHEASPTSSAYTICGRIRVDDGVDAGLAEMVLDQLIQRHESLRTRFVQFRGEPFQVIEKSAAMPFVVEDLRDLSPSAAADRKENVVTDEMTCPFDLSCAPLTRVRFLVEDNGENELLLSLHHIIADGWSLEILEREFHRLCWLHRQSDGEKELPVPEARYRDYVYWRLASAGAVPGHDASVPVEALELPAARRCASGERRGAVCGVVVDEALTGRLTAFTSGRQISLFTVFYAAFVSFLAILCRQERISCGFPLAERRLAACRDIVGLFVRVACLTTMIAEGDCFAGVLGRVFDEVRRLLALSHQAVEQSSGGEEKVRVSFNMMDVRAPGLKEKINSGRVAQDAKFDLSLEAVEADGRVSLKWHYRSAMFTTGVMDYLARQFVEFLKEICDDPTRPVHCCDVLKVPAPGAIPVEIPQDPGFVPFEKVDGQSIVCRFREQWQAAADRVAVTDGAGALSYGELDRRALLIASLIHRHSPGGRRAVGLHFGHEADMVAAILGALYSGNFYVPMPMDYPLQRVAYIAKDAGIGLIITNRQGYYRAAALVAEHCPGIRVKTMADAGFSGLAAPVETIDGDDIAYVLYTSGSTGRPKGVVQNHRNVLHFIRVYTNRLKISRRDRLSLLSPYSFDAAVMDIYGALLNGAVLSLYDVKQGDGILGLRPWTRRRCITIFHTVPTLYRHFYSSLSPEDRFPGLRLVVLGGEAVSAADFAGFKRFFVEDCYFINGLGPTESTVTLQYVAGHDHDAGGDCVPVGFPVAETGVRVVNPQGGEARVFEPGQIVYISEYLALGYLNLPEVTSAVFQERGGGRGTRSFKTGDMGRKLHDGSIEYVGRVDQQVKIKGFRVELSEIEQLLDRHEAIGKSVVVCKALPSGESYLAAYYTAERRIGPVDLRRYLSPLLPDYMIPSVFMKLDSFPLTHSGKILCSALPQCQPGDDGGDNAPLMPRNRFQRELWQCWQEILGERTFGIDDDFFRLGGHSLSAATLLAAIHRRWDCTVKLADIFAQPTIRGLAAMIDRAAVEGGDRVSPAEGMDYYPLSPGQRRLLLIHQMEGAGTGYNISSPLLLRGELDIARLSAAWRELIRRHDSLRTVFTMVEQEPVQRVLETVQCAPTRLRLLDRGDESSAAVSWEPLGEPGGVLPGCREFDTLQSLLHAFCLPFDLGHPPLFRLWLFAMEERRHVMLFDIHHIIADGGSLAVLVKDFLALYSGEQLPSLDVQYQDYCLWAANRRDSVGYEVGIGFWRDLFTTGTPVLDLPADFPRPAKKNFDGDCVILELDHGTVVLLTELGRRVDATLYMTMLAVFVVFLSRISGQRDLVVGSPVAGRDVQGTEFMCGMLANTLPLRFFADADSPFSDFLASCGTLVKEAMAHMEISLDDIVSRVCGTRDASRNPLFDTMFTFQRLELPSFAHCGLEAEPFPFSSKRSKCDLSVEVIQGRRGCRIMFHYWTALFRKETVGWFGEVFDTIIAAAVQHPEVPLGDLDMLTDGQRARILEQFNATTRSYPMEISTIQMIQCQVEATPERAAAYFDNDSLSYRSLNSLGNGWAVRLRQSGCSRGSLVPVMIDHSLELLTAFLAILKIGAAFVPIDVAWPRERIEGILADLAVDIVMAVESSAGLLAGARGLRVDIFGPCIAPVEENPDVETGSDDPMYAMFTSGSTGKPKGVLVPQRGVTNRLRWMNDYFGQETSAVVLQTTRYVYDSVVWQFFWPLANGGFTIVLPSDYKVDAAYLMDLVSRFQVRIVDFVPSVFNVLVAQLENGGSCGGAFASLRHVILGGEEIIPKAAYRFLHIFPDIRVTNLYGPTETTIGCVFHPVRGDEGTKIPIGQPISNVKIYVVDWDSRLLPPGVIGEICIGGIGVGLGYINQIDKTRSVFAPDPFAGGGMMYHTGDLGRWQPDGTIDFIGRIDQQVQIRGVRIELGEIESVLLASGLAREAVVISRSDADGSGGCLCAYVTSAVDDSQLEERLRRYLREKLPDGMIPAYFVLLPAIPLTPAGKIDRKALPAPEILRDGDFTPAAGELELAVASVWAEVLGLESLDVVSVEADFFALGGHSLKAALLTAKIYQALNVDVSLADFIQRPTVRRLAQLVAAAQNHCGVALRTVEEREFYPLSFHQERLLFLHGMAPESSAFNMPGRIPLKHAVVEDQIKHVLGVLLDRHGCLCTGFTWRDGRPVQRVARDIEPEVTVHDLSNWDSQTAASETERLFLRLAAQPFDLGVPPLLKVVLVKLADQDFELLFNMHHIISDGWSIQTLKHEFNTVYDSYRRRRPHRLQPLTYRYVDFVDWQRRRFTQEEANRDSSRFWADFLQSGLPELRLPVQTVPGGAKNVGAGYRMMVEPGIHAGLKRVSRSCGVTLFTVMFAAYLWLLSDICNQEQVCCTFVDSGRFHRAFHNVIGFFVQTVAFAATVDASEEFRRFVARIGDELTPVNRHKGYPLEAVCERLSVAYPRIPVSFNMLNMQEETVSQSLAPFTPTHVAEVIDAKFDMEPYILEYADGIDISWKYRRYIFSAEGFAYIAGRYSSILEFFAVNPEKRLQDLRAAGKKKMFKRNAKSL